MASNLKEIIVGEKTTIKEIIRRMDQSGMRIVLVCSRGKLKGILSFGDLRRALHRGISADSTIENLYNREPIVASAKADKKTLAKLVFSKEKIVGGPIAVPVVDSDGKTSDLAFADSQRQIHFISQTKSFGRPVEKVLVTGGAGYLGSVLVRELLKDGYKIKVLDNLMFGKESLAGVWANRNFDLIVGNILHIDDVVEAVRDVDAIVHLAAIVGDEASVDDPLKTITDNTLATVNLATVCKKFQINRFIYASSCSVYGAGKSERKLSELSKLSPVSLYAQSKIDSEIELLRLADENFAPTILRFATLFGWSPRMRFDLVVNLFTLMAFQKKRIKVFGGEQWRPFIHTNDAASAIVKVLESPIKNTAKAVFNVGADNQNLRILDVAKTVGRVVGGVDIDQEETQQDLRNYNVSFSKIRNRLKFKPKMSLAAGISEITRNLQRSNIDFTDRRFINSSSFIKIISQ